MICYTLHCDVKHSFDSWFQSAAAYDDLARQGRLSCPVCGTTVIEKSLMAPAVRPARTAAQTAPQITAPSAAPSALQGPGSEVEQALAALRRHIEATSDYVGLNFAAEARAMYDGDTPERPIYGEAKIDEARKLLEDGVPVAPLPFLPVRKVN